MMDNGLDIVIRLPGTAELAPLSHCIFSILGQALPDLSLFASLGLKSRLHLMLPRLSANELRDVRRALHPLMQLDATATLSLHNWDYADPVEVHVALLNWALEITPGRYFTCIDIDQVLLGGAYRRLLEQLRATGATLALGGASARKVTWWGDVILPRAGAPPPTGETIFVLDRSRLVSQHLVFQGRSPGKEIADFIDRVSASYPTDTAWRTELLAIRNVLF